MRNRITAMTSVFLFVFAFSFGVGASLLASSDVGACCPPCNCRCMTGNWGFAWPNGPCQWTDCHFGSECTGCGDQCYEPTGPG